MIGSIQMICGMGFIIGVLRLLFGWWGKGWGGALENTLEALAMIVCCGGVWWGIACIWGAQTPD